MATDSLPFLELLDHAGGDDFLRSLAERVLEQLMEFEVTNRIGADRHERTEDRATYRNGYGSVRQGGGNSGTEFRFG